MKSKNTRICFFVFVLTFLISSGQKAPVKRKVEGMWQLQEMIIQDEPIQCDSLYMSFQLKAVQLRKVRPNNYSPIGAMGYYVFTGDSLHIEMKTSESLIEDFGFRNTTEGFAVEEFTHKRLVLRNDYGLWYLRKY